MDTYSAPLPAGPATIPPAQPRRHDIADAPLARAIVQAAIPLGILADDLFRRWGPSGLALPIWVGVVAITLLCLAWTAGRAVSREACAWLLAAVLFAAAGAWRDAEALRFFDFVVTVGALGMAAVALHDVRTAVFAQRLRDTVWGIGAMLIDVAAGIVPVILRDAFPTHDRQRTRPLARRIVRGLVIAIPLVVIFGSLLVSADPIFASLLPSLDFETVLSHTVIIGFFSWIVAGWARRGLLDRPAVTAPNGFPITLDRHDVTMALGTVLVLFATFMLTQLGWIFGGEAFLRARTGLTAAAYARTGFFQLVWVVLLVIPLLLATRAALRDDVEAMRRHTVLATPIVALVGTIMISAALRLRLYVQYYGLTIDRLYAAVFMAWIAAVLVWLAVTVLRGRGRPFVAGAALSGLMTLGGLNIANPDAVVARVNIARAAAAPRVVTASDTTRADQAVDVLYLTTLSGDAMQFAVGAVLEPTSTPDGTPLRAFEDRDRCYAVRALIEQWGPASRRAKRYDEPGSWRSATAGEIAGLAAVSARVSDLYAAERASCVAVRERENLEREQAEREKAERAARDARTGAPPAPAVPPQR